MMTLRNAVFGVLLLALAGCETPYKKSDKKEKAQEKDQSGDTSFVAFLGRLKIAVSRKDLPMMASMMAGDFGYRWDAGPEGENVFTYWDKNGLWPELAAILRQKFVPSGEYMVAPAEVITDPDYRGYRAGLRLVNGSWRFAYFVSSEGMQ